MSKPFPPISELVLYKNNQLIAFNKPASLAIQKANAEEKTLLDFAQIYCKHPVHLIHRLDQPASGLILFAKNKKALAAINAQFQERKIEKTYLAVVKNQPPQTKGKLEHFLKKNARTNRSTAHLEKIPNSKKSILDYELISSIDNYHLLKIQLHTGRHHQIRAQLAAINCPIKGDVKYGFRRSNTDRSIHLHAWKLAFRHPVTSEKIELTAPIPEETVWQAFEL